VIRFGAVLTVVVVAMGLLAGGVLTNSLLLVYLAIGVAALSAVMLAVGLVVWRGNIFGDASAEPAGASAGLAAETAGMAGTAQAPVDRVPVGQTAASAALGPSTQLVTGGSSTVGRDDPGAPPPPALPWRLEDLPEPERLPEPENLREPAPWPEPQRLPEPEPSPEPEDLRKPERLPEPEPSPEPEDLRKLERLPEPEPSPEPEDLRKPQRLPEPEPLPQPERFPEPRRLRKPERLAEPQRLPAPEDLRQERQQRPERPAEQPAPKQPEAEPKPQAEAALQAEATPQAEAEPEAEPAAGAERAAGGEKDAPSPDGQVTIVPGIGRYHRSDCILIRFLGPEDLETMTRQAAEDAGCVPCKACRPEEAG
jgi:hypothetical protein